MPHTRPAVTVNPTSVWLLQSMRSEPSVTLLMSTQPGGLAIADRRRLWGLRDEARRRLADEPLERAASAAAAAKRLDDLVEQAAQHATAAGLALFANADHGEIVTLPTTVMDRVVVDATFATRDLVRALHRTPKHLVLLLSAREARLLVGHGNVLEPARGSKFPMHAPGEGKGATEAFLANVDKALGAYRRAHPSPIVIVAAEPTLSAFKGTSTNLDRLAGSVRGNHLNASLDKLAELTRPCMEAYLRSREAEAISLLAERGNQGRAILGIDGCWLVARWGLPEMLAVEYDFFFPARLTADGYGIEAADDITSPDVIDDLVDELIELVLLRGGWVALVEPGSMPGRSRIALTQRKR